MAHDTVDVGPKGEVDKPLNVNDCEHTPERGAIQELVADVATVSLDASKQNCPRFKGGDDPTCVGIFDRTGLETVVWDFVDHINEISHGGCLIGFQEVRSAVPEACYDVFREGKASRVDA